MSNQSVGKIEKLFGERPQVLDSIVRARVDRKLSFQHISDLLSSEGESVSPESVKNWLRKKNIT